jgi:hypothetical protein
MLRVQEEAGALTVVSRLARPVGLGVLVVAAALLAAWIAPRSGITATALGVVAAGLAVLGGRTWHARIAQGRVAVRPASPFARAASRPLAEFVRASLETLGEARARRAEAQSAAWSARAGGGELPSWLRRPEAAELNDQLRRIVLVGHAGERVPLTAWLPPEDDLEALRAAVEARLR